MSSLNMAVVSPAVNYDADEEDNDSPGKHMAVLLTSNIIIIIMIIIYLIPL
jgi:hypothetical protein